MILPITSVPLFFWACPCYYLHVIIFPPTKHFVSLLSICLYKFIYTKSEVQGFATGYWPLRPGAWDSELSMPQPDFNLCPGNQNPSLSCCRLSRLRSKVHYFIQWTTLHSAKATTFKNHHFRVGENEFSDYKEFICFNENINIFPCPTFYFIQIWMNSKISNFSHVV